MEVKLLTVLVVQFRSQSRDTNDCPNLIFEVVVRKRINVVGKQKRNFPCCEVPTGIPNYRVLVCY